MTSTDITFTATYHGATRKNNSVNGNPTWELKTDKGNYRTQTDSQIGYSVSNYNGGPDSLIGQLVRFTATKAGRVWDMKRA